jgi:hypothetical protein
LGASLLSHMIAFVHSPVIPGIQMKKKTESAWPNEVQALLGEAGVRQVAIVPDAGHQ